jgi:hypothetical protein
LGRISDIRFQPETPNVVLERVTAERVDFSGLMGLRCRGLPLH